MPPPSRQDFIARWSESAAAERANKDLVLTELCDVLGVARAEPAAGEEHSDQCDFEKGARLYFAPLLSRWLDNRTLSCHLAR